MVDEEEEEEEEADDDVDDAAAAPGGRVGPLSAHARATERMAAKLSKLEQAQLAEKPWQLQGEVGASRRPRNSLLEADLDFEHGSKIVPVITEEVRPAASAHAQGPSPAPWRTSHPTRAITTRAMPAQAIPTQAMTSR